MGIKIIKNDKLWMEESAISQLQKLAVYEGVLDIVGLPDLHFGKTPIGTTIKTKDIIYPFWIGNDIGCGMSLYDTSLQLKKCYIDKIVKKLENTKITGKYSIGGGNHFCELQMIDCVYNSSLMEKLSLNKNHLYVLVHSGSRQMGDDIYNQFASTDGLRVNHENYKEYMNLHDQAVGFARENRNQIADIFMGMLGYKYCNQLIIDCIHNYIEIKEDEYYHHKGSISTQDNEYAVIAGSRGSHSYIVKCISQESTLYSISHGAGRKWPRHLCKGRLETKYKKDKLKVSQLGSRVITYDKAVLYEEASEAYKDIHHIIDVLLEYRVIELVARLKPLVTYKC